EQLPFFAPKLPVIGAPEATAAAAGEKPAESEEPSAAPPAALSGWKLALLLVFLAVLAGGFLWTLKQADVFALFAEGRGREAATALMTTASGYVLPVFLVTFVVYAALAGLKVFEEFIEGAKEGMGTVMRIIPYLVAMIVAIG